MRESLASHQFAEKDSCIIGDEDEFEPVEIEGAGRVIYRRKPSKKADDPQAAYQGFSHLAHVDRSFIKDWKELELKWTVPAAEVHSTLAEDQGSPVAASAQLQVSAKSLGVVMTSYFGALLTLSAASGEVLIYPVAGWIGLVFGASFALMGTIKTTGKV